MYGRRRCCWNRYRKNSQGGSYENKREEACGEEGINENGPGRTVLFGP
jgi:hypothetical protein